MSKTQQGPGMVAAAVSGPYDDCDHVMIYCKSFMTHTHISMHLKHFKKTWTSTATMSKQTVNAKFLEQ